ncbi:MAG: HD domain-containing protein [Cyanobacteria bacterium SIG30]|nr:HD domain-containing protein [Cyanobacteria bacterium SIG30]
MQINNNLLINPIKSNFNDKVTTLPYGNVNKNQQDSYTPFIPRKQSGIKQAILDARNNALIKISPQSFINSYLNKRFLNKELQNNPNIKNVLRSKGIIPKLEIENVKNIINSHLIPTMKYATGIMQASGEDFSKKDYEIMAYASLLHDTGKTLIPSSILNKKGTLTTNEKSIVDLHSNLGFELLKNANFEPEVLDLISKHHANNPNNKMVQILKIADVFSALKEDRPYRKAFSNEEAFKILEESAQNNQEMLNYINILKTIV